MKIIENLDLDIELYSDKNSELSKTFDSGKFIFNEHIANEAIRDSSTGDGVTYIVTNTITKGDEQIKELVAYYTISTFAVHMKDEYDFEDEAVPEEEKRIHYNPINSFLINMFAVNEKYQDARYKEKLVSALIFRGVLASLYKMSIEVIGAKMIVLCAVKDAVKFYKRNEFKKFDEYMTLLDKCIDDTIPMYLPLHENKNLVE